MDSQCLSYLIDAIEGLDEPTDALADQRVALFRTYLYREGGLFITPTVKVECERIRDVDRAAIHKSWISTFFGETQPINQPRIDVRTAELEAFHHDSDDCRILAEAEDAGLTVLLSFDSAFILRLRGKTNVVLLRPLDYWLSLRIPKGSGPVTVPHHTNPLTARTWWRW